MTTENTKEQPAPVAKPHEQEPVEVKQIAEALRQVGLTLVRTGGSFRVMDLGRIEAQTTSPPAQRQARSADTWVGLTNENMYEFAAAQYCWEDLLFAAEAKLKEKNFA